MAQYLIRLLSCWLLLGFTYCPLVFAEVLRDPTMPPAQFLPGTVTILLPESQAMQLQSVTLGSATKYALINGHTVMLGEKYNGYRLVRLSANQAQLKAADGTVQTLNMEYNIEKNVLGSLDDRRPRSKSKPTAVAH